MSRTYRDLPPNERWLRRVKTMPLIKNKIRAQQEIKEELGCNYLAGNFAELKNIPTFWDDLCISAYDEYKPLQFHIEEAFVNSYPEVKEQNLFVHFECYSNIISIKRRWGYWRNQPDVYLLPFIYRFKDNYYPIKVSPHNWYR